MRVCTHAHTPNPGVPKEPTFFIVNFPQAVIKLLTTPDGSGLLGRSAMAAHQTLDLWILVRIQAPQPVFYQWWQYREYL